MIPAGAVSARRVGDARRASDAECHEAQKPTKGIDADVNETHPSRPWATDPPSMRRFPHSPRATVAPVPVLDARGISKTVGAGRAARLVLDEIDLAVEADEVVASKTKEVETV